MEKTLLGGSISGKTMQSLTCSAEVWVSLAPYLWMQLTTPNC